MNAEIAALTEKAEASLAAARMLLTGGFADFAISRAYYAMFYTAEALLLTEGLTFSKHAAVTSAFGQRFAKTGRVSVDLHRYLLNAGDRRAVSDYAAITETTPTDAEEQIRRAEAFIAAIRPLLPGKERGA